MIQIGDRYKRKSDNQIGTIVNTRFDTDTYVLKLEGLAERIFVFGQNLFDDWILICKEPVRAVPRWDTDTCTYMKDGNVYVEVLNPTVAEVDFKRDDNYQEMPTQLDVTLKERGLRYGSFVGHAAVTQRLKEVVRQELETRNKVLRPTQQEAIDMIMHKLGRIINGDADYDDSWIDIAGYAQLEVDRIHRKLT